MSDTNTPNEGGAVQAPPPKASSRPGASKQKPKQLPPYNVVLLDDDDHSYDYVIEMLGALFAYPEEKGFQLAEQAVAQPGGIALAWRTPVGSAPGPPH